MPKESENSLGKSTRPIFRTTEVSPPDLPAAEATQLYLEAQVRLQRLAQGFAPKDEVVKAVEVDHPIKVYVIGDLHFGHIASDSDEIINLRDRILSEPYSGVIFVGDEIEGYTVKYPSTSTSATHADAQQQIELIQELLFRPLAEQGRILGMVGDYFGHPGWIEDATTINPQRLMANIATVKQMEKQLDMYNAYGIQILGNSGHLHLEFPNGHRQTIRCFHYPEGKSKKDPLYGLREDATDDSIELRPEGSIQGHIHKAAIAKEHYAGTDIPTFYISSGTTKGSSKDKPRDRFGRRIGRSGLADPIGQGVIIIPRHRGDRFSRNYPFISFDQSDVVAQAIDIWNSTESQGTTVELLQQINTKDRPGVTLVESRSRKNSPYNEHIKKPDSTKKDPDDEPPVKYPISLSPVNDSLTYNVNTQLPITLHLISNARLGATVEGFRPLKNYLTDFVSNHPHSLVVYLRNMIDREVLGKGELGQREVNRFIKQLINPIKTQTIAVLLDQNFRDANLDTPPGSFIAQETGVPLIHHLSMIKIAVGPETSALTDKPMYIGAFADKLERSGSYDRPTFGLSRAYHKKLPQKPGFVTGGHMPNSGTMMIYHTGNSETNNPALIAPGWWSGYVDTIGQGNVKEGALPGQAIIFMPGTSKDDYMVFPTANADETKYMHDALILLKGLALLGLTPADVISKK